MIEIYIYSNLELKEPRGNLEDDLEEFLEDNGEVSGAGSGEKGWNIDLNIHDVVVVWPYKIKNFLKEWGVPEDCYLKVYHHDWEEGDHVTKIDVHNNIPVLWHYAPGESPYSIGWAMGSGEDYMHSVFRPYWNNLSDEEKQNYVETFEAEIDWREWLMLIDDNKVDLNKKSIDNILDALHNKDLKSFNSLVKEGADLHHRTREKATALHIAAENGMVDAIDILLSNGLDVNAQNMNNTTPLSYAISSREEPALMIPIIDKLLKAGADIHHKSDYEILSDVRSLEMMKYLLGLGLDPTELDDEGESLLGWFRYYPDIVEYLINLGLDVNHYDKKFDSSTILHRFVSL